MTGLTMQDLLKQAEDAGISSYTPPDKQVLELEVVNGNGGRTKNGDPKFGIQFKVASGPDTGKSFWSNYNLRATKANGDSNAQGLALTFKDLAILGADSSTVAGWDVDSPLISEQVKSAVVGTRVQAEIALSGDFVNLKKLKALDGPPAVQAAPPAEVSSSPSAGERPF